MSQDEVLFSRKKSSFSQSEEDDDVWDDRKINDAYDRGVKLASAELAKRLAMKTNTKLNEKEPKSKVKKTSTVREHQWKAGKCCRALYHADGLEYEAIIERIISNEECVVKYLGYDNTEIVALSSLKPSKGVQVQAKQIEKAMKECDEASDSSMNENPGNRKRNNSNIFNLPELPPMPSMSMLRNLGSMDIPMPPPPPMIMKKNESDDEQQILSSMLLSWYMNGYYTGLYQAMRNSKTNKKK